MTIKPLNVYRTYFPDPPGGLQEAIKQICISTAKVGIKQTIFTLSPKVSTKVIELPEAQVVRTRSWLAPASCDIGGLESVTTFSQLVTQASLVQYHFPWPFADLLHAIVRPKIPAITIYHSDIVRQKLIGCLYAPLMWKTLQRMDLIIATSPVYAQTSSVLSHSSLKNKVRVIPLGIDESSYQFDQDDTVFERINMHKNEPYILFLGVLRYYKGVHTLINAAKSCDAKIVIAGSGSMLDVLRKQVFELGLTNIYFAGQVTQAEKVALLKNCRAFVLPSHLRSEAFGMVLVEASMFGKPMISCEIDTGTSYVNLNEVTGLIVPPDAPIQLANALQMMIKDENLAENMGLAARQRYQALFSGDVLGRAYQNLYEELL